MGKETPSLLGASLLVAGTAIGAAMLALPVSTGLSGIIPSCVALILCWLYMTYTALLMIELQIKMGQGTNLLTMATRTLGIGGRIFSCIVYLFLLYSLNTAYIAGTSQTLADLIQCWTGYILPQSVCSILLAGLLGWLVFQGVMAVDGLNRWMMCGLITCYFLLIVSGIFHVDFHLLSHQDWKPLLPALSVIITSFGFHIIIPTLSNYLNGDVQLLRKAVLLGSCIPMVAYVLWQIIALGSIPLGGDWGIYRGYESGLNGAELLAHNASQDSIRVASRGFAFFAIFTSFLGVALSLFDFLADGTKIRLNKRGKLALSILTFLPPLVVTWINPRAFLSALEWAGAFGVVVLLGLIPIAMVYKARYVLQLKEGYQAPGGKVGLAIATILSTFFIIIELSVKIGLLA